MARIIKACPQCSKPAEEVSHSILSKLGLRLVSLKCGHSYTEKLLVKKNWEEVEAQFGRPDKPYPYQGLGYEFARDSGFRALIADEPGLGKTLQSLLCLKLHHEELCPALVICKFALKMQYMKQIIRWLGVDFQPQIISDSKDKISSIFPITITTYDLLHRLTKKSVDEAERAEKSIRDRLGLMVWDIIPENEKHNIPEIVNPFKAYGYKTVILDECQQIKNPASKRAQQVVKICENIPHIIATSGTPIKNHAGEYFTILNILRPEKFPSYKSYLVNYCDWYHNGRVYKVGGLRDVEWFKSQTSDFIIRRTEKDVELDLPTINRKFIECDFASEKLKKEYEAMAEEFSEFYYDSDPNDFDNILAKMTALRHKVGVNKIPFTAEFVTDFLMDTEPTRKIVIFVHHLDVAEMLRLTIIKKMKDEGLTCNEPLMFFGQDMQKREQIKYDFIHLDNARVMIASTKSAGEGVDGLQEVCHDCIVAERQWTPADEEQVERRFKRIGAEKGGTVNANYILTTGTIDEFFTELVEKKRAIMAQTLDGDTEYVWDQSSLMKELAETLARKGSKKWRLQ